MHTFADLCCGSAAVARRLLSPSQRPLVPYMGSKLGYAESILALLDVLGQRPERIILADSGPWGRFWHAVHHQHLGEAIIDELRSMRGAGASLMTSIHQAPVPQSPARRWACFLALQAGSAFGKPVGIEGASWVVHGYAHLSESARAKGFKERLNPRTLADRLARALAGWPPTEVFVEPVESMPLGWADADTVVYIDPPYSSTEGYSTSDLSSAALRSVANTLFQIGASVAVSEQRPLPWPGWYTSEVTRCGIWQPTSFRTAPVEWLTTSAPPSLAGEQLPLALP
ncbi:MAG: hypothetical protein ACE366_16350 [Bradymonadia bacterium]